eukprot:1159225-Pelagomonas_calceolata.AAC.1
MDPNPAPGFGYADRLKPKRKLGGQLGAEEYQESVESVASKADDLAKLCNGRGGLMDAVFSVPAVYDSGCAHTLLILLLKLLASARGGGQLASVSICAHVRQVKPALLHFHGMLSDPGKPGGVHLYGGCGGCCKDMIGCKCRICQR